MDPYEQLREQLPEEMKLTEIGELMRVAYSKVWLRMKAQRTPSHVALYDGRVKLVNRDDVIELLRIYKVLG
jgi:hypothetical protein